MHARCVPEAHGLARALPCGLTGSGVSPLIALTGPSHRSFAVADSRCRASLGGQSAGRLHAGGRCRIGANGSWGSRCTSPIRKTFELSLRPLRPLRSWRLGGLKTAARELSHAALHQQRCENDAGCDRGNSDEGSESEYIGRFSNRQGAKNTKVAKTFLVGDVLQPNGTGVAEVRLQSGSKFNRTFMAWVRSPASAKARAESR